MPSKAKETLEVQKTPAVVFTSVRMSLTQNLVERCKHVQASKKRSEKEQSAHQLFSMSDIVSAFFSTKSQAGNARVKGLSKYGRQRETE